MARDVTTTLDIYARVSQLGDSRMLSTQGQVRDCVARVEEFGGTVGEIFVDAGRSAWNPRVHRPAWTRLMERLETGASGGVVVFDLSRFSRRPRDGERLIEAAERGLVVLDSEHQYNLTSPDGKVQFRDQMKMAGYYSDRLSTTVQRGKRLRVRRGESIHSTRPFGWERDGLSHREDEAAIIRDLAERLLAGVPINTLIDDLNSRGVRTSTGKRWDRSKFYSMLTLPRHAGLLVHRRQIVGELKEVDLDEYGQVVGERLVPPILDRATWDRVRAVYAARKRGRPRSDTYLLSGIARCGLCGTPLTGRPRGYTYADGTPVREYWCQPRSYPDEGRNGGRGGCGRLHCNIRGVDAHVAGLVVRFLGDPRHAASIAAAAKTAAEERERVEAEVTEIEGLLEELAGRLGRREINLARHDAAARPLELQLAPLVQRRDELERQQHLPPSDDDIAASRAEWEARWLAATVHEQRAYIRRALRDRHLVVAPGDPTRARRFDPDRVRVEPADWGPAR